MTDGPQARTARLIRRRRLLVIGAAAMVLALLVGAKAVSMTMINEAGRTAYAAGSLPDADREFTRLAPVNAFSPWVAWNNRGTAQFGLGAYDVAETDFRRALQLVPTRHACVVAVNLASTLEKIGDDLTAAGDAAGGQQRYEEGIALIDRYGCPRDEQTGDNAQQTKQRLEEKTEEQPEEQPTPSPSPAPNASASPTPSPSEDPQAEQRRQQQQDQKNADAQRERNTERQRKQGQGDQQGSSTSTPADKPW